MASSKPKHRPSLTHELLSRGHSPDSAHRIFQDKIQHRSLLLCAGSSRPDPRDVRRKARQQKLKQQRSKPLKAKPLSARERRKLGLHDVPRKGIKYHVFQPLNRLWLGYVREILGNEVHTGGEAAAAKLCSADFHGAEVEVCRSRCPSRVGIKGIVVKDSKFAFELVTSKDRVKLVPKEGTVFRIAVPVPDEGEKDESTAGGEEQTSASADNKFAFEIHGDRFQYRSADRANKKFRLHFLKQL